MIGRLNDLWVYRMNDSTWTWISGNKSVNQPSIYKGKGIPSPNNQPGAREGSVGLYDSLREVFWLFGGFGYGSEGVINAPASPSMYLQAFYQTTIHSKHSLTNLVL